MYRKIEARMWTDPKFRRLKSNEKLVFLYLITCPGAHVSGVYYLSIAAACDETGLSDADLRYGIDTLSTAGLIRFDQASSTVWVVNMLRYQGRGGKIMKCVANHLADIHSDDIISKYLKHYETFSIPYRRGIDTQPIGKPELAYQEQDQEQEKEKPSEPAPSSSPPPTISTATPVGAVFTDAINQHRKQGPETTPDVRRPPDRSHSRALMPDARAGGLQTEIDELRMAYAAAWGANPALVPSPAGDDLKRVKAALSDEQAGTTQNERDVNAFAAIRGHRREASKDGSSYGRDFVHIFPPLREGNSTKTAKLNFSRYMQYVRAGTTDKAETESDAEQERREREAEIVKEMDTPEGIERRKGQLSKGKKLFDQAAREASGGKDAI